MANPNLKKKDLTFLKVTTEGDEIKELKIETEKHDLEKISKSLKIDNECFRKKFKSSNKKKDILIITEIFMRSASTKNSSTIALLARLNQKAGVVITTSTALLTSSAILITSEYISKLKIRCTRLQDWIKVINFGYERTLNQLMVDKKLTKSMGIEKDKKKTNI